MIECSSCGEWFHRMCERVKDDNYDENNIGFAINIYQIYKIC